MKSRIKLVENMQFVATADSGHAVLMDAPQSVGGNNSGAKPSELLLMAFGGCSGMDIISILRFCTGMSLLLTAYEGSVVAPHYTMDGSLGVVLLALAGLIGILLISNHYIFETSILMLALFAGLIIKLGFVETIEYWNFVGIAVFLMFNMW